MAKQVGITEFISLLNRYMQGICLEHKNLLPQ